MLKIAFNKTIIDAPYGGSNHFLRMMKDYLIKNGFIFTDWKDAEILFLTGTREYNTNFWIKELIESKRLNKKVIYRVNDCDLPRSTKEYDNNVKTIMELSNMVIFVSDWCKNYFKNKNIWNVNNCVIRNLPDKRYFYPNQGSNYDGKNLRIVTHHYSDNLQKGYLVYCMKILI